MFLGALALTVLAGADVSLELGRGTPCVNLERVRAQLLANGVTVTPDSLNHVSFVPEGSALRIEGRVQGRMLRRTVSTVETRCVAVERLAVTLVSAWVHARLPHAEPVPAVPHTRPQPVEAAPDVGPPRVTRVATERHDPESPPTASTPPESIEPSVTKPEPPVPDVGPEMPQLDPQPNLPTTPVPTVVPVAAQPAEVLKPFPIHFDASLLGGAIWGTGQVVPSGSVSLGAGYHQLGLLLDVVVQGLRTQTLDTVTLNASLQSLTLSVRGTLEVGRWRFEGAVGFRGTRIVGFASGVDSPTPTSLVVPGGALTVGARWQLWGPLFVQARVLGAISGHSQRFTVLGSPASLLIEPFEIQTLLGLAIEFGGAL